jgi:hypothetical protein
MTELKEGTKYDGGKLRLELLPVRPLLLLADVYTRGAKKYAAENWRLGLSWSRVVGALERHVLAWKAGEQCDPQDGQHHLASVAWCALTLMEYEITHKELDDRICQRELLNAIRDGSYMQRASAVPATSDIGELQTQKRQSSIE